jgi:hypothetical protein
MDIAVIPLRRVTELAANGIPDNGFHRFGKLVDSVTIGDSCSAFNYGIPANDSQKTRFPYRNHGRHL